MKQALITLLNEMDKIVKEFEEVTDTYVREQMNEAIYHSLIQPNEDYFLPSEFGMFSKEGNAYIRAALSVFIDRASVEANELGLHTPQARLDAFQDIDVRSHEGNTYDEYFGHRDSQMTA
jgi:hypothetical protein